MLIARESNKYAYDPQLTGLVISNSWVRCLTVQLVATHQGVGIKTLYNRAGDV
jgi:hypothetical protein